MSDIRQQAGSLELEDRGQVRQHQSLRLHGSRIDPGFPDRIEEQCDLGARRQCRRHFGAARLLADDLPVDEEVAQVEGHLGVDLEWNGGADLAPVPEGEGQAPGGDPVTRQAHHHVFGGEVVHLDEVAELAGQGRRGIVERQCAELRDLHSAEGLPELHRLHRVASEVES